MKNQKRLYLPLMEINEYEAGMLDAVLEAFAGREEVDWTQLLELFDGDEELAVAITDILEGAGLVIKKGEETKTGLPERIIPSGDAIAFMNKGGFTAQVKGILQSPAVSPAEPEPQPAELPTTQTREVIFEIEKTTVEELTDQAEIAVTLEPEVAQPIPVTAPETLHTGKEPVQDLVYQQEIARLRSELMRSEHKLREKDAMIHEVSVHNEQLGRFRIFIWVLLGLMALLVAGLVFHSH